MHSNTKYNLHKVACLAAACLLTAIPELHAQSTINRDNETRSVGTPSPQTPVPVATPAASVDARDDIVELSPFIVQADRDDGYVAADSLAGTRIRTPLKDIASTIAVVTKDMLDDLAANNIEQLLVYTAGTEVVGVGGNFSDSRLNSGAQDFEAVRENANPNTRVRGLAGADQTRNYFLNKAIPLDSYNTQSVTVNRGANSVLFGFGSPAGIIENTMLSPRFRNAGQVRFSFGSFDSYRTSLDLERILWKNKLSVRFAMLGDNRGYEQRSTFRDQERYYAAVTFKPFKGTSIRVNGENGHLDQLLPRVDPPVDSLTTWWDFNQPTRANVFDNKLLYPDRGPTETAWQRANNLDGMAGNWQQNPGLIYYNPTESTPADAIVPYARVMSGSSVVTTYRFLAPRSSQEIAQYVAPINPLYSFMVARQLLDRSIFDYRKEMIDGPNNGTWLDFNTQNVVVEQLFLNGNAGVELAYDRQKSVSSTYRTISTYRGNNIFIDANTILPDGRPNPNFGRPFISANGYANRDKNLLETYRATAFAKYDFSKKRLGFLSWLLGTQTVTGMLARYERNQDYMSGYNATVEPSWTDGLNANTLATSRKITAVVYLGPSLAGLSSPAGINLMGVRNKLIIPETVSVMNLNSKTDYAWARQAVSTYVYPNWDYLANSVVYNYNKVDSQVAVWQGYWMGGSLVSTMGWRRDTDETGSSTATGFTEYGARSLARPALDPARVVSTSANTFSYSLAFHVPSQWFQKIPGKPQLSVYYNNSENFDVAGGVRRNVIGDYIAPQQGKTEDYGFRIAALDNRLSIRFTWYETTQNNMSDNRISNSYPWTASLEEMIMEAIPKATLDSLGYVGFDSPNGSELFRKYMDFYNFSTGATRPDGTREAGYASPGSVTDVTSSISKGLEIEGVFNPTKNWRIAFNVVKQKAQRGPASAVMVALMYDRLPQWEKVWDADLSDVQTVGSQAQRNIVNPINTARLSNGENAAELREWRVNIMTNYTFPKASFLKGWGVGGAFRWEDSVTIGYPVINDPTLGLVTDVKHPFMGPSQTNYDAWLSYSKKFKYFTWKVQLNIRNLLNKNTLIPVKANPVTLGDMDNYDVAAWRIGVPRTYEITSTFAF
jgi:outer membrane receptor protein involved in Fe transport